MAVDLVAGDYRCVTVEAVKEHLDARIGGDRDDWIEISRTPHNVLQELLPSPAKIGRDRLAHSAEGLFEQIARDTAAADRSRYTTT